MGTLHPVECERPRLGGQVLQESRKHYGLHRALVAGGEDFHCASGWDCEDAASAIPCLYVHRVVAMVLCAGVDRTKTWREMEFRRARQALVPSSGCGDPGHHCDRRGVVRVASVEASGEIEEQAVQGLLESPNYLQTSLQS